MGKKQRRKVSKEEIKKWIAIDEEKSHTPERIFDNLNDFQKMVPDKYQFELAKYISLLPYNIIDFIIGNCFFISMEEDNYGQYCAFDHFYYKDAEGIILLNHTLWKKEPIQIAFTIAHEVAHQLKQHIVKKFEDTNIEKARKREKEADELASKWLSNHYMKEDLKEFFFKEK